MSSGQRAKPTYLCLMITGESSNMLIWPLHVPLYNFSVIRITNI